MKETIKVIELLQIISRNEKIPKKIKYKDTIYEYDEYLKEHGHGDGKFKYYLSDDFNIGLILNEEVEIIKNNVTLEKEKQNETN